MGIEERAGAKTRTGRAVEYLNGRMEFRRWELVKYALASLCIFLPCLGRFLHYFNYPCLFVFAAFFCLCFALLTLFRVSRKWLIPFIAAGIFGVAYQFAIGKPLGYQTLSAMYETNYREMLGFLSLPYAIPLIVAGAAALGAIFWLIVGDRPLPGLLKATSIRRRRLLMLLLVAAALFATTRWRTCETYPVCLLYNNFMYIDENIAISDYTHSSYSCPDECKPADSGRESVILIIGESARRDAHSIYGYPRETSPELAKLIDERPRNVLVFKDAVSSAAFTKASVMSIYSPLTVPEALSSVHTRPGLSKIFKGSGASTLYVTTRPRYTVRNMLSTFLDDTSKSVYLTTLSKRKHDEEIVPEISGFLETSQGRSFVIAHLMGSHFEYASQYPKSYKRFTGGPDKMRDAYDDSIRYSDHVIARIAGIVMSRPEPSFAIYVSDHGENLNDAGDGNYGHGTKELTRFELEVPFVVFMNDAFLERHARAAEALRERGGQPVCHDNIAHTLMGVAGLSDPFVYRSELDVSSASFKPGPRFITDENMHPFDYASYDFSKKGKLAEIKDRLAEKYLQKFTW